MIPLVKSVWNDLMYSPEKARLFMRGFFLWAGTVAGQVVAAPNYHQWTAREWLLRLAVGGAVGMGGLIGVGERNPK